MDAGADPVLSFVDGGLGSTYCSARQQGCCVSMISCLLMQPPKERSGSSIEIADGLLQKETAALLQSPQFVKTVDTWLVATGDPVAAVGAVGMMRGCGNRRCGRHRPDYSQPAGHARKQRRQPACRA